MEFIFRFKGKEYTINELSSLIERTELFLVEDFRGYVEQTLAKKATPNADLSSIKVLIDMDSESGFKAKYTDPKGLLKSN